MIVQKGLEGPHGAGQEVIMGSRRTVMLNTFLYHVHLILTKQKEYSMKDGYFKGILPQTMAPG